LKYFRSLSFNLYHLVGGIGYYNSHGDVVVLTDSSAQVIARYPYDAYGNLLVNISSTDTFYGFQSKEYDPLTGLSYFGARYYSPFFGRFITQDPSGFIDGPNLYTYCRNNPLNLVDLWGRCGDKPWWPKWIEIFLPGYGVYGGPMRTDPTFTVEPEDSLDRLFREHDIGWSKGRGSQTDKELLQRLYRLPLNPQEWEEPPRSSLEARFYRRIIAEPVFWWINLGRQKK